MKKVIDVLPRPPTPSETDDDQVLNLSLRPKRFDEFVGQARVVENLRVAIQAARRRTEPLEHLLLAGPPGLGKTSIGHTQPRRIAARTIAERIAEELGQEVGEIVGYQVRFTDHVGKNTRIKLMTDGILLNEIHRDRDLKPEPLVDGLGYVLPQPQSDPQPDPIPDTESEPQP